MNPNEVHAIMSKHTIGDGDHIIIDLKKSQGSYLVDALTQKRYLDCASQFASQALGWNHPKLVAKKEELGEIALHKVANSDYYTVEMAEFVKTFAKITPDFRYHFFIEGGTLAVENALKAAFDWKAKKLGLTEEAHDTWATQLDVVHLKQAFHGRSGYTLSLTNTVRNKTALFPKFSWTRAHNPKILNNNEELVDEKLSLMQIEAKLSKKMAAAIIMESIQGEGGDNHFNPDYVRKLQELANKYEAMFILDEVQTGLGMTGKMWCYEHFGIVPDMICFGKKTQVCGFCCTEKIDEVKDNVFHVSSRINSTWGGNIVDMVRAKYIIDIIKEDDLVENAAVVGSYLLEALKTVPNITNVRGRGLFIAFDPQNREQVMGKMKEEMTCLPCGENSIRLRPHLTFSKEDADEAVRIITKAVI